jgi:hypothetical protein
VLTTVQLLAPQFEWLNTFPVLHSPCILHHKGINYTRQAIFVSTALKNFSFVMAVDERERVLENEYLSSSWVVYTPGVTG